MPALNRQRFPASGRDRGGQAIRTDTDTRHCAPWARTHAHPDQGSRDRVFGDPEIRAKTRGLPDTRKTGAGAHGQLPAPGTASDHREPGWKCDTTPWNGQLPGKGRVPGPKPAGKTRARVTWTELFVSPGPDAICQMSRRQPRRKAQETPLRASGPCGRECGGRSLDRQ